ncbi:MAG: HAD family hydrolase [Streptosporangiales bacterium]
MSEEQPERGFDAVLCDLDGVLRRWDPDFVADLEKRYGVPKGTLLATAFDPELLQPAVTGAVSDDEWRRNVAAALLPVYGMDVATGLVADWSAPVGTVDEGVRELLAGVRASGVRVGICTNGTTRLEQDIAALGLVDDVDAVVSSAALGVAKPEPAYFFAAALMLEVEAERCVFVDDTQVNVDVAKAVGMRAHLYEGVEGLRAAIGQD